MKKLSFLLFFAAFALIQSLHAQVGINILNPDSSAILHINSNTKGVLLPELNINNRTTTALGKVKTGMLIFDPIEQVFYFRDSNNKKWVSLNPWRTADGANSDAWGDIRLDAVYNERNVYIGQDLAQKAQAKLHIGGTLQADEKIVAKNGIETTGDISVSGSATVAGTLTGGTLSGYGSVPLGGIIMWSGTDIPDGWALCNGTTSNGIITPDLQGKFIVGLNPQDVDYNTLKKTGGEKTHILSKIELPRHQHAVNTSISDGGSISISIGAHTHLSKSSKMVRGNENGNRKVPVIGLENADGGNYEITSVDGGDHYHTIYGNTGNGTMDGLNGSAHENRPPYYVLAFIMRVK